MIRVNVYVTDDINCSVFSFEKTKSRLKYLFSRFYRCVKFNQYENDYTIFEYGCPTGLVFDDRYETIDF